MKIFETNTRNPNPFDIISVAVWYVCVYVYWYSGHVGDYDVLAAIDKWQVTGSLAGAINSQPNQQVGGCL